MEDDRTRSWSGGSSASTVSFQSQMAERNGTMVKVQFLLQHLPHLVKELTWELQNEFSKSLNPQKESGNDWRIVASRLQFSSIIPHLEQKSNPTIELLRECTVTTCKELLEILVDVRRSDVLDDIMKFINNGSTSYAGLLGAKLSKEESLDGDSSSKLSWPLQDSGNCSSMADSSMSKLKLGPQESEENGENFFSDESEKFWLNIAGDYERKSWKNFVQAAKDCCPTEMQQGNVEKFLCKVCNIDCANDSHVRLDQFLQLVALFGPFKPGADGCLQKMYNLMKKSISMRDGAKESWFAGHMNETEAANLLSDQSPGYFLIRISSSRAHEGVFVLAVKTRDNGVVQIQIERDLDDGALVLAERKFEDLMSVVDALRRDVLLENCRQLLINPCPGLPLNAIFSGYMEATARRGGRGRGRTRR